MNPGTFDRISKRFATLAMRGSAAQEAAPVVMEAEPWDGEKTTYLFVQSFHAGSIVPTEGQDGRYTVTLEQGTGQTIYFADRPSRDVGVTETPQFLEGLGFAEDNPPNAALVVETAPGETDVAVVELFNPTYDPATRGVSYDVEALETWREDLELGLREAPADLADLASDFGTAHLLIDDCPSDATVVCYSNQIHPEAVGWFINVETCYNFIWCMPCEPYGTVQPDQCATTYYWGNKCNEAIPACNGECWPFASTYALHPCPRQ